MNEEKWWDNQAWCPFQDDFKKSFIEPLVEEAMRRGKEEAFKEIHFIYAERLAEIEKTHDGIKLERGFLNQIEAKLTELKKV